MCVSLGRACVGGVSVAAFVLLHLLFVEDKFLTTTNTVLTLPKSLYLSDERIRRDPLLTY
jgi:hypothetical protein